VALGATAANYLLGTEDVSMRRMRGRFHTRTRGDAVVMPTYHPAYLLRNSDGKRLVWEDMKQVMARLGLQP
jgi:DNA polymerase